MCRWWLLHVFSIAACFISKFQKQLGMLVTMHKNDWSKLWHRYMNNFLNLLFDYVRIHFLECLRSNRMQSSREMSDLESHSVLIPHFLSFSWKRISASFPVAQGIHYSHWNSLKIKPRAALEGIKIYAYHFPRICHMPEVVDWPNGRVLVDAKKINRWSHQ